MYSKYRIEKNGQNGLRDVVQSFGKIRGSGYFYYPPFSLRKKKERERDREKERKKKKRKKKRKKLKKKEIQKQTNKER